MSAETWYVDGSGVLIRSGRHLLLLGAEPGADVLGRCWEVLSAGPPGDVPARLLALVDEEHPHSPLVLLDLAPGSSRGPVVRGGAEVVDDGTTRRVRLDTEPTDGPWLPLTGGIVAAGAVDVRQAATTAAAPGVIDGIPPELLRELVEGPTSELPTPPAGPATVVRPPPEEPRTVRRATLDLDQDGAPGAGPARPVRPVPPATGDTVLAVRCPHGHVTSALAPRCRVCQAPVAAQQPERIPRPSLGSLLLPSGERVPLDRGVVLGRRPAPLGTEPAEPHLVHLPADNSFVSRLHLSIELDGWLVVARDLGSRGGTSWQVPGRAPERMRAHEPYLLEPGHRLDLADSYAVVYEVTA